MTIEPQPTTPTVPVEPQIVEITGADLVLQLVPSGCEDDPVYLVPSFELRPAPVGSVVAVAEDSLAGPGGDAVEPCPDQVPTGAPVGKPEPAPLPADTGREPAAP
jgi:hypothetical protein